MDENRQSILVIDNYDSFTYNLCQMMAETGLMRPVVVRNDERSWNELDLAQYEGIVVSPGPGNPARARDFGMSADAIAQADIPVFGVCLGHQGIGHHHGMQVKHAPEPMHGRISAIRHDGGALFDNIPSPFHVVRYHSLVLADEFAEELVARAWSEDGLIMALEAQDRPLWGMQFHPESICTEYGAQILKNFAHWCARYRSRNPQRVYSLPPNDQIIVTSDIHATNGANLTSLRNKVDTHEGHAGVVDHAIKPRRYRVMSRRLDYAIDGMRAYRCLYEHSDTSFFLDSSRIINGYSRFSYLGDASGPLAEEVRYDVNAKRLERRVGNGAWQPSEQELFEYLDQNLKADIGSAELPFDFVGGFVGYLGYEMKADCDTWNQHQSNNSDASMMFIDRFIVIDHQQEKTWLVHLLDEQQPETLASQWFVEMSERLVKLPISAQITAMPRRQPIEFQFRHNQQSYEQLIRDCQSNIRDGESYEICLTNQVSTCARPDPLHLYQILRKINPAPYAACLRFDGLSVMCSSPERFLTIDRDGWMEAKPIKGTICRHNDPLRDEEYRVQLRDSEKDRAENLMIVDLLRNDLGIVAEPGTVRVPKLMDIESYATVHQMVSTIVGRLQERHSPVTAVRAAFPGGSMTGAPKIRTMEIIDELEAGPRGIYSGCIGYFSLNGAVDLNIVIRTIVIDQQGTHIGTGGAITWLSDPRAEYEEILLKSQAPMRAIALAMSGDESAYILNDQAAQADNQSVAVNETRATAGIAPKHG